MQAADPYKPTHKGHKQLDVELDHWRRLSLGVERVIAKGEV